MVGGWGGVRRETGRRPGEGRGGKGVGEARANALLMVFIQAWRLQARPPRWQLGVNFPPFSAPPPSLISECCHSGGVEEHPHQLEPPFHTLHTFNTPARVGESSVPTPPGCLRIPATLRTSCSSSDPTNKQETFLTQVRANTKHIHQ